jgi:hypothetical protein
MLYFFFDRSYKEIYVTSERPFSNIGIKTIAVTLGLGLLYFLGFFAIIYLQRNLQTGNVYVLVGSTLIPLLIITWIVGSIIPVATRKHLVENPAYKGSIHFRKKGEELVLEKNGQKEKISVGGDDFIKSEKLAKGYDINLIRGGKFINFAEYFGGGSFSSIRAHTGKYDPSIEKMLERYLNIKVVETPALGDEDIAE